MKEGKMESKEMTRNEADVKFKELKEIFDTEIKKSDLIVIEFKEKMGVTKEFDSILHFLRLPNWIDAISHLEKAEQKINALLEKIKKQTPATDTNNEVPSEIPDIKTPEPKISLGMEKESDTQGVIKDVKEKEVVEITEEKSEEEILARLGLKKGQTINIREDFFDKSSRGKIGIIREIDEEGNLIIDDEKGKFLEVIPKDDLTPVGIKEYLNLILEPTEETSEQDEPIPPIPSVATPENLEETGVIERVEQFTPEQDEPISLTPDAPMTETVEEEETEKQPDMQEDDEIEKPEPGTPESPQIKQPKNRQEQQEPKPSKEQFVDVVDNPNPVTPLETEKQKNTTQQAEKDTVLAELRKTIENAKKIIEENTKREEVIIKKLKKLREESDKAPKKTDEETSEESLSEVGAKLTNTQEELSRIWSSYDDKYHELNNLKKRIFGGRKRKKIREKIKELKKIIDQKTKEVYGLENKKEKLMESEEEKVAFARESEKAEAIEKDKKERPFLYFVAERIRNPYLEKDNQGLNADLRWATWMTTPEEYGVKEMLLKKTAENEGYFIFNMYGFVMIIKNVKEIRNDGGIDSWSDQAIYRIVDPKGEVVKDDIKGYNEARKIYDLATNEYRTEIEKEFDNLNK